MNVKEAFANYKHKVQSFFYYPSSKKKIIAGVLGLLVLTASLSAGVYLVKQRQTTKTKATGPILSFSPSTTGPIVGSTFTVTIGVDTQSMNLSAADIRVRYDTSKLEAVSIEPTGDFLPIVLIPGTIDLADSASGRAQIVLGCLINESGAEPKSGVGVLARVTFRAKAAGATNVTFGSETALAAIGQSVNVVGTKNPVTITIIPSTSETIPPTEPPTAPPTESPTESPTVPPTTPPTESPTIPPTSPPSEPPGSTPGGKMGDVNLDNSVNLLDINEIIKHYGALASDYPPGDINGDGAVNILDVNIVIQHYGE